MVITSLSSCGLRSNSRTGKVAKNSDKQRSIIHDLEKASGYRYVYTDTTYASSTGKGITIQNSFPKGGNIEPGTPYTDSMGKVYFFVGFWTRIISGTNATLDFKVSFPADSFPLSSPSDAYLKLFVPRDTMTFEKLSLYSYGLTRMKTFLDTNFNNATLLHKTLEPDEEHIFYTIALSYQAGGPARSAMILKEKELLYKITMGSHGSLEIPCGRIAFENIRDK